MSRRRASEVKPRTPVPRRTKVEGSGVAEAASGVTVRTNGMPPWVFWGMPLKNWGKEYIPGINSAAVKVGVVPERS